MAEAQEISCYFPDKQGVSAERGSRYTARTFSIMAQKLMVDLPLWLI